MELVIIANPHDLNGIQEGWFIQNILFRGAQIIVGYNPGRIKNKTVIYLELNEISPELIAALKSEGNKVVLYHMGDEFFRMSREQYKNCDLVIRNYFSEEIFGNQSIYPHVMWVPCGYKSGVGPRESTALRGALNRQWLGAFFGWLNNPNSFQNERLEFAQAAPACGENLFLLPSDGFGQGVNTALYSAFMEDAIFAPCPAGNSPETIRLFDALECGAVPIMLKHDFIVSSRALGMYSEPPIVLLDSWTQLPIYLDGMRKLLLKEPAKILELQSKCIQWWTTYKSHLGMDIGLAISKIQ